MRSALSGAFSASTGLPNPARLLSAVLLQPYLVPSGIVQPPSSPLYHGCWSRARLPANAFASLKNAQKRPERRAQTDRRASAMRAAAAMSLL
ncbi:hypothetical protein EV121DRAFT_298202 [Schizophyllum commune]